MSWLVPRNELTIEQSRAVELSWDQHRLVLGSPGSGKTIVLVHRARHLIDTHKIPQGRYRLLIYTRVLKAYIRAGLDDLRLPIDSVTTFDSWCWEYYRDRIRKGRSRQSPSYDAVRRAVWKHTRHLGPSDRIFDFVLVDEGQDLDCTDFETLRSVSRHVTVFMDPKQKIYERDADAMNVAKILGKRLQFDLFLLDAYRCSPYIAQVGSAFIIDEHERKRFLLQNQGVDKGARQIPLLYLAEGAEDERRNLIEWVRICSDRNERIAILFPTNRHVFGYAEALQEAGIEVEVKGGSRKHDIPDIDFNSTLPKIMAMPSVKGLTVDTVLMARMNRRFLKNIPAKRLERLLFVGITRAMHWVAISTTDGEDAMFLERFCELEKRRKIVIQRASEEGGKIRGDGLVGHLGEMVVGHLGEMVIEDAIQELTDESRREHEGGMEADDRDTDGDIEDLV